MDPKTALPEFVQWIQALGPTVVSVVTALIAGLVGIVAYRQWRTAREKLVLDLFQRRFNIYVAAKSGVDQVMISASTRNNDSIRNVSVAGSEAVFLFGNDVCKYLESVRLAMINLQLANDMMAQQDRSRDWPQEASDRLKEIGAFYDTFPEVAAPYMRMDQKLT